MDGEHAQALTSETAIDDASRSLFRLGRAFGRLPRRDLLEAGGGRVPELSAIFVVQAVEVGEAAGSQVTIGEVAARLGVDPSTASRLVAQTAAAGYLRRVPAHHDKRAAALELTAEGQALGEGATRFQRSVFDAATSGWSEEERQEFARLFVRFAEAVIADVKDQE